MFRVCCKKNIFISISIFCKYRDKTSFICISNIIFSAVCNISAF
ncbi:hypothetical protein MCHI_002332 [Candidatus Magnetoovum chiemensis]|nr:hypothetical protein MCHI_002332 [Candidatus Magnetoovum chiemensis]